MGYKNRCLIRQDISIRVSRNTKFNIGNSEIETRRVFKYLGRVIDRRDDDCPDIRHNIKREKSSGKNSTSYLKHKRFPRETYSISIKL